MKSFVTRATTGLAFVLILLYLFIYAPLIITSLVALAILFYILVFEWTKLFNYKRPFFWIIMPFYPILPFALLAYMCSHYNYRMLVFFMFILTSCQDSFAYLVGSLIGKHKLIPKISPKKTWEGFFGGYAFVTLALAAILIKQNAQISLPFIIIFSFFISVLTTLGDIFVSFLKRKAGIKDTGNILPGHGGFLDRLDSALAAIFLFFILKDYLLKIFNI